MGNMNKFISGIKDNDYEYDSDDSDDLSNDASKGVNLK